MTKQEYDEIMKNLDSDDVLLRIQAQFIKSMFPSYGSGQTYEYSKSSMASIEDKLRKVIGENLD